MVDYVAKKEFERVPWTNGVLDVLGSLVDAGIPSVLVTTSPRRLAQNVIDHAPAGAFAGFVCGDDDLPHKPDPAPYLAAAKMRPSKSTKDMEPSSLKKKFKDKKFAAGCSRDVIRRGADQLGWELDKLMEQTILAMRSCEDRVKKEMEELEF